MFVFSLSLFSFLELPLNKAPITEKITETIIILKTVPEIDDENASPSLSEQDTNKDEMMIRFTFFILGI